MSELNKISAFRIAGSSVIAALFLSLAKLTLLPAMPWWLALAPVWLPLALILLLAIFAVIGGGGK